MPRKKKTTTITEEIPETTPDLEFDLDSQMSGVDDSDTLGRVLKQFGDAAIKIKVSRQTPKGPEFCFTTDEVDEDFIQTHYGGGDYTCRIFINEEYKTTVKLKIAGRLQPLNNGGSPSQFSQADSQVSALKTQVDFLQGLLLKSFGEGGQPRTPIGELTQAIQTLHGIGGNGGTDKLMDIFLKGVEFAKDISGNSDWKQDLLRTVREVGPDIMKGFSVSKGNGNPPALPGGDPTIEIVRGAIVKLKKMCLANTDTDLIVDWVMANVHDEQHQFFLRIALSTDFAEFAKLDPEIGNDPYVTWFKTLYDGLRSAYQEQHQVDVDSEGKVGDKNNVVPHDPTRKGRGA